MLMLEGGEPPRRRRRRRRQPPPRRPPPRGSGPAPAAAAPAAEPAAAAPVEVKVPDIGDFDDGRRHRGPGQAGRHDQGRAEPDHRRERQGFDGDSVVARRHGEGAAWSRSATRCRKGVRWRCVEGGGRCGAAARRAGGGRLRRRLPPRARRRSPRRRRTVPTAALPAHEPKCADGQRCRMRRRRCGASRASSAWTWRGQGQRAEGPHHPGRRAGLRQGRDGRRPQPGAAGQGARRGGRRRRCPDCCRGRRSTSPSSAPVERKRPLTHQEDLAARTCIATG